MTAADVGDLGASPEPVRHSAERWDPVADQAGPVADLPEPLSGCENGRVLGARGDRTADERMGSRGSSS